MPSVKEQKGVTIIEMVVGMGITALLVAVTGALLVDSIGIWGRRSAQAQADADVALAMQRITRDLSQALSFTIDDGGNRICFFLPAKASDGGILIPVQPEQDQWGAVRIHYYRLVDGALHTSERAAPLIANMPSSDPETGLPYQVFARVPGTTNQVVVTLASRQRAGKGSRWAKITQQVTLRNCD
jgi:type II secretory pathway pseudopilin PulG